MAIKQDSNLTNLCFAEESALKTLPGTPTWYGLEPNSYTDFGASISQVARNPINPSRQKQKGTITDLDASGGFNSDLTQTNMQRLLQGFFFANAHEKADTQALNSAAVVITAVSAAADTFAAASGLGSFLAGQLVICSGFANAANNGLHQVISAASGLLTVLDGLVDEVPTASARIEAVGIEGASGDLTLTASASSITLNSTVLNFTTLNLTPGEWIFIGGDATANQFALNLPGYARVKSIAANVLALDESTFSATTDTGVGKTIRLFFGKCIKNEKVPSNIVRRSYQLERTLGNDGVGIQSEYLLGAIPNEFSLTVPIANKITCDLKFVALEAAYRTGTVGVKAGNRVAALGEDAFNTSNRVYRIKMGLVNDALLNPNALFAYVTDFKMDLKNGVTPLKAIGVLGAFEASTGDFDVSGSLTAYFADVTALNAVRNNLSVSLNSIFASDNHGIVFDTPNITLSTKGVSVDKDASITLPIDGMAFESDLGHTMSVTFFNYLPTIAMPA